MEMEWKARNATIFEQQTVKPCGTSKMHMHGLVDQQDIDIDI